MKKKKSLFTLTERERPGRAPLFIGGSDEFFCLATRSSVHQLISTFKVNLVSFELGSVFSVRFYHCIHFFQCLHIILNVMTGHHWAPGRVHWYLEDLAGKNWFITDAHDESSFGACCRFFHPFTHFMLS